MTWLGSQRLRPEPPRWQAQALIAALALAGLGAWGSLWWIARLPKGTSTTLLGGSALFIGLCFLRAARDLFEIDRRVRYLMALRRVDEVRARARLVP